MNDKVRTTAVGGLRFRDSPLDGNTIAVLPHGTVLDEIFSENWLRVRTPTGEIGFVSADYVEPIKESGSILIYEDPDGTIQSEKTIRIHSHFLRLIEKIKTFAAQQGIKVFVTSSLRRPDRPVPNAIVDPARVSNHHVGFAIDVNLISDEGWLHSSRLGDWDTLPDAAKRFLEAIQRDEELRWGGKFSTPDPVHIDHPLNWNNRKKYDRIIAKLWGGIAPTLLT